MRNFFKLTKAFLSISIAIYIILIIATFHASDISLNTSSNVTKFYNIGDKMGAFIADFLLQFFGISSLIFCIFFFICAKKIIEETSFSKKKSFLYILIATISFSGTLPIIVDINQDNRINYFGFIGHLMGKLPKKKHTYVILLIITTYALLKAYNPSNNIFSTLRNRFRKNNKNDEDTLCLDSLCDEEQYNSDAIQEDEEMEQEEYEEDNDFENENDYKDEDECVDEYEYEYKNENEDNEDECVDEDENSYHNKAEIEDYEDEKLKTEDTEKTNTSSILQKQKSVMLKIDPRDSIPSTELLKKYEHSTNIENDSCVQTNAQKLEEVLSDFGINGKIVKILPGPIVTLYELEPAPGIKSSRVIGLSTDIARSLSAISIRIAIIPGKNVIGIEIPNHKKQIIGLRSILESSDYKNNEHKIPLALGITINGDIIVADLTKMPHLLIAGTTGSGKSVAINTMIMSIIYSLNYEECKFIMIDPKMLELSLYNNLPHLITPVVTDPKKAVIALKWVVEEMESRYRIMSQIGVRNIDGYNNKIIKSIENNERIAYKTQSGFNDNGQPIFKEVVLPNKKMPNIVVIVDEMADLMLLAGKEIESLVQRLAQMARASGIHIIMATQRPSVDVITGVIKANFPTRISFAVTSKIDSRTILGEQGAESLLGMGDMLYMSSGKKIQRLHGPFISDKEIQVILEKIKQNTTPQYIKEINTMMEELSSSNNIQNEYGADDELYAEAVSIVKRERKASISYLQRQLKIGFNRAASLIERMEKEKIVSEQSNTGKRVVLTV